MSLLSKIMIGFYFTLVEALLTSANHRDLPGRIKDINYKNVQAEQ